MKVTALNPAKAQWVRRGAKDEKGVKTGAKAQRVRRVQRM